MQKQQVSYGVCEDKQLLSSHCYQDITHCLDFLVHVLLFVQLLNAKITQLSKKGLNAE